MLRYLGWHTAILIHRLLELFVENYRRWQPDLSCPVVTGGVFHWFSWDFICFRSIFFLFLFLGYLNWGTYADTQQSWYTDYWDYSLKNIANDNRIFWVQLSPVVSFIGFHWCSLFLYLFLSCIKIARRSFIWFIYAYINIPREICLPLRRAQVRPMRPGLHS